MKTGFQFLVAALALTMVAGVANAQAAWCADAPNGALTINGVSAGVVDPINHDVTVTLPGTLVVEINTNANANAGLALLVSPMGAAAQSGVPQGILPWDLMDSLDIGTFVGGATVITNVQVIGDGLNPAPGSVNDLFFASNDGNAALGILPTFTLAYSVNTVLNGQEFGTQAIVREPTNGPFFLDNTSAASINLLIGLTAVANVGDDGSAEAPFTPGYTFDFHGVQYPSVWLNGNGYANFGGLTTVNASGFLADFVSLVNAEPFIAPHNADWSPQVIGYQQIATSVVATWGDPTYGGNMAHFGSTDNGNLYNISLELNDGVGGNPNEGQFGINHTILVDNEAATANHYGTGARGHGPGGAAIMVTPVETDLNQVAIAGVGEGQLEEHSRNPEGATFPILNGWDSAGSARGYNNADRNWNGHSIQFLPNPPVMVSGDSGYVAIPDGSPQAEDVGFFVNPMTGAPLATISDAGGTLEVVSGSWQQLLDAMGPDPMGVPTVVFDPAGLNLQGFVVGIRDTSGTLAGAGVPGIFVLPGSGAGTAHRDMQALEIITPVFPMGTSGTLTVQFTFSTGAILTTSVLVASPSTIMTTLTETDDSSVGLALTNVIPWYGVPQTQLFVGSNGDITFTQSQGSFTNTTADMFAGFNFTGGTAITTPGCSPLWTDLNSGSTGVYQVIEDVMTGATTVAFSNQNEWGTIAPLGGWTCTFDGLGMVTFDYSNYTGGPFPGAAGFTFGVTDGDALTGGVGADVDFSNGLGTGMMA